MSYRKLFLGVFLLCFGGYAVCSLLSFFYPWPENRSACLFLFDTLSEDWDVKRDGLYKSKDKDGGSLGVSKKDFFEAKLGQIGR